MTGNIDYLVQRQASILAKIDNLSGDELDSLANRWPDGPISDEIVKAWKLLSGLVRTGNVGRGDLRLEMWLCYPGIVTSPPGFFAIDLLPLPEGGYDREQVMKTPVVAWELDSYRNARPIMPGTPMTDRFAVLMPTGFVITDKFTSLFSGAPVALKDWIKGQIEWVEGP